MGVFLVWLYAFSVGIFPYASGLLTGAAETGKPDKMEKEWLWCDLQFSSMVFAVAQISWKLLVIFCVWQTPWAEERNKVISTKLLMLSSEWGIKSQVWVGPDSTSYGPDPSISCEHLPGKFSFYFHFSSSPTLRFFPQSAFLKLLSNVCVWWGVEPLEMGQRAE